MLDAIAFWRFLPLVAAALVVGTFTMLALSGGALAGAGLTPDPQLLRTYQPVVVLHPGESFLPGSVQSFVADARLEALTGTNPLLDSSWTVVDPDPEPGELPGPGAPGLYRLNQAPCTAGAALGGLGCYTSSWLEGHGTRVVYGRVVHTGGRIVLQYWLFYYDNTLLLERPPYGTFWQAHEGDWEVVNVVLAEDGEPLYAGYSRHCSGARRPWAAVPTWPAGGTHPLVYVSLGSHANYFEPGLHLIDIACVPAPLRPYYGLLLPADVTALGPVVGPPGSGAVAAIHTLPGVENGWTGFPGRWGETEYLYTPVSLPGIPAGTYPAGLAPVGPAYHAVWTDPLATLATWPPTP